jgi:hypothetical protein
MRGVDQDLAALDLLELQQIVSGLIYELAMQHPVSMKALTKMQSTGDLRGAWAAKFDIQGYPNRYRLVFDYIPNYKKPDTLRLIAVGLRFDDQVYRLAAERYRTASL